MFSSYLHELNRLYRAGNATEHSCRPALHDCLSRILNDVQVTNEPKRQRCGAPDYILTRHTIAVGYIEAKDMVGIDLDKTENEEQLSRYRTSLDNLILTNYVDFRFFLRGQKVEAVCIAEVTKAGLVAKPENFARLEHLLVDFAAYSGETIKSAKHLAAMMAHKAALMREVFFKALQDNSQDQDRTSDNTLKTQLEGFQAVLMHDMDEAQFADVYAQTIAYGLFTARLHDESRDDFTRAKAATLIPRSNPFLRQLFQYVAGVDLDDRVAWIVDALCEVYRAADLPAILQDFGATTAQNDPILHFYETFLTEYDPKLRKARGVWYTPEPVVRFIVRAVDEALKTDFDLKDGIAHTGMVSLAIESGAAGKKIILKKQVHKVQLLDVATGTGTFLAEAIKQIYSRFKGQEGVWSGYVEQHLLPRLHGFEVLMAPYAMCHMKLDLLLKETGYHPAKPSEPPRLGVYLTNSLEEYHPDTDTLFAQWLAREANAASRIKKDMPIMVAMGNPPYSGHSVNQGVWMETLLEAYKQEPGGKQKLQEKNGKWLNDDYVKFMRLGEHYIAKNGEGILAYITNHGYLDNPTFRGMRWHLLNSFDAIYVLDLHGNAKKKETAPDGSADKNVFDIQQGVAILIAVKKRSENKPENKRELATLYHADLWGTRQEKYATLNGATRQDIGYARLKPAAPHFMFIPRNHHVLAEYETGFAVDQLFPVNSVGIVTARDSLTIHETRQCLEKTITRFASLPVEEARYEFALGEDAQDWKVALAQQELKKTSLQDKHIQKITYRPFDTRWTYYTGASKGFHCRARGAVMQHFLKGKNVGLMVSKQQKASDFCHVLVHCGLVESSYVSNKTSEIGYVFPLYTYEPILGGVEQGGVERGFVEEKRPNLNPKIYQAIQKSIADISPQSLFDYIYAVLHSRTYRTRYAAFLKSDFPRIPYPSNAKTFHRLAKKGEKLRELHLMESAVLDTPITTYPITGTNKVGKLRWEVNPKKKSQGRVWINETQYFDQVPQAAWAFYIGGYQPAQKWLKDRKDRVLTTDHLMHWQRIIVALAETDKVMEEIDNIAFLPQA